MHHVLPLLNFSNKLRSLLKRRACRKKLPSVSKLLNFFGGKRSLPVFGRRTHRPRFQGSHALVTRQLSFRFQPSSNNVNPLLSSGNCGLLKLWIELVCANFLCKIRRIFVNSHRRFLGLTPQLRATGNFTRA